MVVDMRWRNASFRAEGPVPRTRSTTPFWMSATRRADFAMSDWTLRNGKSDQRKEVNYDRF